jgi:hypothetical protein
MFEESYDERFWRGASFRQIRCPDLLAHLPQTPRKGAKSRKPQPSGPLWPLMVVGRGKCSGQLLNALRA